MPAPAKKSFHSMWKNRGGKAMSMDDRENVVMGRVRRALGRAHSDVRAVPVPPAIDDNIARLVPANADLIEVFTKNAKPSA